MYSLGSVVDELLNRTFEDTVSYYLQFAFVFRSSTVGTEISPTSPLILQGSKVR